jgi:hypothetical protein
MCLAISVSISCFPIAYFAIFMASLIMSCCMSTIFIVWVMLSGCSSIAVMLSLDRLFKTLDILFVFFIKLHIYK